MKYFTKTIMLALCALIAGISTSCITYYTVESHVGSDGSLTRTVHGDADSACLAGDYSQHPFLFYVGNGWEMGVEPAQKFTFVGDEFVHDFYARRTFAAGEDTRYVADDEKNSGLPYLNGREEWRVERGFFADRYYYTCTFPAIGDMFPLPLDGFMDEEEKRLFFKEGASEDFKCLNGMEIFYYFLADANSSYSEWERHCIIEYLYNLIVTETGAALSPERKSEMVKSVYNEMRKVSGTKDDAFNEADIALVASSMTVVSGNEVYAEAYKKHQKEWEAKFSDDYENVYAYPFTFAYRYIVEMPGKVTATNANIFEDGAPAWKVDGFRLLGGDVTITAESREVNVWSFVILGLIVIIGVASLCVLRRKRVVL